VAEADTDKRFADIKDDLSAGTGCVLSGKFAIDKVSGNFHISFHNYMQYYQRLLRLAHDDFMKLNLSYEIEELTFGLQSNEAQKPRIRQLLTEMQLDEQLLNNYIDHKKVTYDHFIAAHWMEIVPYSFRDNRDAYEFSSYLHSFNRKIKPIEPAEIDATVPILEFHYKFSSLSARYEIETKSMFHFGVEVLAVVGALLAFFQLFNSYSYNVYTALKKSE